MRRHVFSPLIGRGWSRWCEGVVFSGILHELAVGVPTHNILGVAFVGMVIHIPLIFDYSATCRNREKRAK